MSELSLDSRYIHTGNSGVTIRIDRDVKRSNRAVVKVENGAMGAFSTSMRISGNSYEGMTSDQLRDIALCFLEAASKLDNKETESSSHSPHVASADPLDMMAYSLEKGMPSYISDLLPSTGNSFIYGKRSRVKVRQLLDNIPDIVPFYSALLDELATTSSDSTEMIRQQSPKTRSKMSSREPDALDRKRAKRRLIIYYGIRLLRSLHVHDLAAAQLGQARIDLSNALLSTPKAEEEAEMCEGIDLAAVCYKKADVRHKKE